MADLTYALPPATVGATYNINIQLQDSVTGLAPSLAGYSGDLQVRQQSGSTIVLEASTSNGFLTLNTPQGNVALAFSPVAVTTPGSFLYELKLVDGSGNVSKPMGGTFMIPSTITP